MTLNLENCPLISYLRDQEDPAFDIAPLIEIINAANTGDPDMLYGYGLMLHEMAHNKTIYPQSADFPEALIKDMDKKAFEIFVHGAQKQHAQSALMTAYMLLVGEGTDQDTRSAILFFYQAKPYISKSDPRIRAFTAALKTVGHDVMDMAKAPDAQSSLFSHFAPSAYDEHDQSDSPLIAVEKKDLATLISPLTAAVEKVDNMYLISGLAELTDWLKDGFKNEDDKGTLYVNLIKSLHGLSTIIKDSPDQQKTITIDQHSLSILKTSYCQINEAALQIGGVAPKDRNIWLPNFGMGHAPDEHKGMGTRLRDVVAQFNLFFKKYDVPKASDKELEAYANRPVVKSHAFKSHHPKFH